MKAYLTQIKMTLRIMMRNRGALFFGYFLPLGFFFLFGQMFRAQQGGASQVLSMVLTIGVLGSGFFGAALYAVMNREQNILRRFKVAPVGAAPILVASLVASLVNFLPMATLTVILANRVYGMPLPSQPLSLLVFVSVGLLAFCSIGNIIAAVVNSMQEAQIVTQIFYMPMLMLGGATIPLSVMPDWLQVVAQFMPSTYYNTGIRAILGGGETIFNNLPAIGSLFLTIGVGTFLALKLFRWEKEEKMQPAAKLWLGAVLAPFLVLGVYQAYAKDNIQKVRALERQEARDRITLIKDARIVVGDGTVIDRGSVLIRGGKIAEVFNGQAPDAASLNAGEIEAAGRTLLPGLIDAHIHLGSPGVMDPQAYMDPEGNIRRELNAYLYSGVTAVKSVGDGIDYMLHNRAAIASGERLGAELFLVGPLFTAEGGHGTEYFDQIPEQYREMVVSQSVRTPKTAAEAREQVAALAARGVDGIKIILEAGTPKRPFNRMDPAIVRAVVEAAHEANLRVVSHTGNVRDIADALDAGVDGLEHGSMAEAIPAELFVRMKEMGVTYDPTLAVVESLKAYFDGDAGPLDRSLVAQVTPRALLEQGRQSLKSPEAVAARASFGDYPLDLGIAKRNLAAAYRAGVRLVTGTDSGNPLLIHGPAIHRELQLWVEAGIPPQAALESATLGAAKLLGAGDRIGSIQPGREASLLLVEGNPLEDIAATERISLVFFKGERINRPGLLEKGK